jgi:hypothetical protein
MYLLFTVNFTVKNCKHFYGIEIDDVNFTVICWQNCCQYFSVKFTVYFLQCSDGPVPGI